VLFFKEGLFLPLWHGRGNDRKERFQEIIHEKVLFDLHFTQVIPSMTFMDVIHDIDGNRLT
jgi:hypothetical protein